uniref:TLC domain containing 3B n=1 Tax=Salarias fasciatus TaxID=181472 RepID=A0A672HM18_SALFA
IVVVLKNEISISHWLTDAYIFFATPYFAYDVYAMYLCHHHRLRVKGHEEAEEATLAAVAGFLRRESLMVLHHVFLVAFCFPASVFWRQGKGDYFQALLFLAELSTPSVSLGKVLIQVNRPSSGTFLNMRTFLDAPLGSSLFRNL